MFYIDKEQQIDAALLSKMILKFTTERQPQLEKWKNQYDGKHKILQKQYSDKSKVCNRIVTNFCRIIVQTFSGYIAGKPISYTSNEDIEDIMDVINYNDSEAEDIQFLESALTYGIGYELFWLDKDAQVRFSQINPVDAFPIYANDLDKELLAFVRWYDADNLSDDELVFVEVYDSTKKSIYKCKGINGALEWIADEAHFFQDVPVAVFALNDDCESVFNQVISLNDAYNEIQSSEVDDFSAWCDSYLVMSGMDADADDIASMKENRVLILPEGAQASWLTKTISDVQVENMLMNIRKNIFKISNAPDMGDENFMAQSGVAIQYKLVGFENASSAIVARFTKAIQKRIELICNILNIKASDALWRDVQVNFVRNLPSNTAEIIQMVNSLTGIVSDKTLLSQLDFIQDVDAEIEAVQEQKESNMQVYGLGAFGSSAPTDEFEEEEE